MTTASVLLHPQPCPTDQIENRGGLPHRVAGQSLAMAATDTNYDDSLTIYRGVARAIQLGDPLFGPAPQITELPVEYFEALRFLERLRDGLLRLGR